MDSLTKGYDCQLENLNVFTRRPVQSQIKSSNTVKIRPNTQLGDSVKKFIFKIEGSSAFLDLSETLIFTECQIQKVNPATNAKEALAADVEVSTINYLGACMWDTISLKLNNQKILTKYDLSYRSYMEAILSHDESAQKSWLQASMFYKDQHRQMNTLSIIRLSIS